MRSFSLMRRCAGWCCGLLLAGVVGCETRARIPGDEPRGGSPEQLLQGVGAALPLGRTPPIASKAGPGTTTTGRRTDEGLDTDHDDVLDGADQCPLDPEDHDRFRDEDGCPDPDNDGDGVQDGMDQCPGEPETRNGVQDEDGCPEGTPASRPRATTLDP